ncbi:MAG: DUF1259 domain-containing protein [Acaryochloridaceae cyanobacterium RU_4_10]|nr:DUF1259 domain-containing protein [Acaryochloridaceae cyanobacterium RU_4_10]
MNSGNRYNALIVWFIGAICAIALLGNFSLHPFAGLAQQPTQAQPTISTEWKGVEQAMGKPGTLQPGNVLRFGFPRSDLKVMVDGIQIEPTLALGSWVAFNKMGDRAMVMGDLVLLNEEIAPVMSRLQQSGIEQAALHNHLGTSSPMVFYMHISGQGNPVELAQSIRTALTLSKTPLTAPPAPPKPQPLDFDTQKLEQILGYKGKVNGGVYQFSVPRAEKLTENGMAIPASLMGTALNFQPIGLGKAAITGDLALLNSEVNPVIRVLREHNIQVTAIHSHTLNEEPRLFHMHFWAKDNALKLAQGLRAVLDKTNSAKPSVTPRP